MAPSDLIEQLTVLFQVASVNILQSYDRTITLGRGPGFDAHDFGLDLPRQHLRCVYDNNCRSWMQHKFILVNHVKSQPSVADCRHCNGPIKFDSRTVELAK